MATLKEPLDRCHDEVLTSLMEFAGKHHLGEQIDESVWDNNPVGDGERFVIALGETLDLVMSMHESGDLALEWPQADRLVAALLAMAQDE